MSHLENYISRRYGKESTGHLIETFNKLGLPVPQTQQDYRVTADGGALIFLNAYNCVIRITEQYFPAYDHPHILQPIASFPDEDIRIEINPGITCPAQRKDIAIVDKILHKDLLTINNSDRHELNIGLLPAKTANFPEGIPVVIEMPAVRHLTQNVKDIAEILKKCPSDQKEFYAPLRQAFCKALDKNDMKEFWQFCTTMKKNGALIAGWKTKPDSYHAIYLNNFRRTADSYQKLCIKHAL